MAAGAGPRNRRGGWTALGAACALTLSLGRAHAADIVIRCPRLDAAGVDELSARARLVLRTHPENAPPSVVVRCDADKAWLEWGAPHDRIPIDESDSLIEGALDALEYGLQLQRPSGPPTPDDAVAPREASEANELPNLDPSVDTQDGRTVPPPPSRRPPTPGGVGLSVDVERWEAPAAFGLGPHLDIAAGSGRWCLVVNGGFMAGLALQRPAYVVDTQLGLAWGAPFAPRSRFGLIAATGGEWFAGVDRDGNPSPGLTSHSWIVTAGGRWSAYRASHFALWLGLDARLRLLRQQIGSPLNYSLFPATLVVEVGGFALVER